MKKRNASVWTWRQKILLLEKMSTGSLYSVHRTTVKYGVLYTSRYTVVTRYCIRYYRYLKIERGVPFGALNVGQLQVGDGDHLYRKPSKLSYETNCPPS